jgi:drug/metabolite transporter (DMT)-like permease
VATMLAKLNNPKTWAGAAGVFGIALVLSGMMTQMDTKLDKNTRKCETSPWNALTIIIGCILLIACIMTLFKRKKDDAFGAGDMMGSGANGASGASEASVSPEPTPGSMTGAAMPLG